MPLFYENRTPELQLTNPQLNEDIYRIVDDAGLNEVQEEKLGTLLGRQYHILTRDDRLDTIAKDIVWHFLGRGFQGKAMVVSLDKATALKMYDKVQKHWLAERQRVQAELAELGKYKSGSENNAATIQELNRRLEILKRSDMALVVSEGQNEVEQMRALGLDIAPHRKRMNDSRPPLDEKFKDPQDPLSLVFVCAMWLTGFDAPSCSTIYLDKPMRNHTLMQTIARANRVYPGKHSGLIVDYANVFESLERALAIYGIGAGGERPVQNKTKLVEDLRTAISDATLFCVNHGVALADIERAVGLEKLSQLGDAVNAFITPDPLRNDFLAHLRVVQTLFDAVKPDRASLEFSPRVLCLCTIAGAIKAQIAPGKVDVSNVMSDIQLLLDRSVGGVKIQEDVLAPPIDLSKLDFAALATRFKQSPRKNIELETLKSAVRTMLDRLIRLNKTRIDFQERFEELIEAYNSGTKNIEDLFNELLALSQALTEEQARHVRENLTEEELTIFDILTRPGPSLTSTERDEVKRVAHLILERLKTILTFNWRQTIQARAKVRNAIEEALDSGLPRTYTPEIFKRKAESVFEHAYERYSGAA